MENRQIERFPVSSVLSPVFHFSSVLLNLQILSGPARPNTGRAKPEMTVGLARTGGRPTPARMALEIAS